MSNSSSPIISWLLPTEQLTYRLKSGLTPIRPVTPCRLKSGLTPIRPVKHFQPKSGLFPIRTPTPRSGGWPKSGLTPLHTHPTSFGSSPQVLLKSKPVLVVSVKQFNPVETVFCKNVSMFCRGVCWRKQGKNSLGGKKNWNGNWGVSMKHFSWRGKGGEVFLLVLLLYLLKPHSWKEFVFCPPMEIPLNFNFEILFFILDVKVGHYLKGSKYCMALMIFSFHRVWVLMKIGFFF